MSKQKQATHREDWPVQLAASVIISVVVVIAAIAVTTLLAWIGPVYDWSQRNAEAFFREPPAVWRETNCPACVVIGCEAQRLESIDPGYHLAPVQPGFIPLEGSK